MKKPTKKKVKKTGMTFSNEFIEHCHKMNDAKWLSKFLVELFENTMNEAYESKKLKSTKKGGLKYE